MPDSSPTLVLPPSETLAAGGTLALSGISYQDSAAAANSGSMYLRVSDSDGTLQAHDSAGAVNGSGSNSITVVASYSDITQVLNDLVYAAPASAGSDTIRFDLWDQYGTETIGSIPVSIGGAGTSESWTGTVSSDWNNAANWSGGFVPTSGDTVTIAAGTPYDATLSNATLTGETIDLVQSGSTAPVVNFNDVTLDSRLQGNGGLVQVGGTLTIGADGTIAPASGTITLNGSGETVVNNGLVLGSAAATLQIDNMTSSASTTANFINNGSVLANGGSVQIGSGLPLPGSPSDWMVDNSGSIGIAGGGSLDVNGTIVGGSVDFHGAGGLQLEQPMAFSGGAQITGFGTGDVMDLRGGAYGTVSGFADGTLQVTALSGGTLSEAIPLSGSLGLGNFEDLPVHGPFDPSIIAYAPSDGGTGIISPDVVAPASATVAQGATLGLGDVSLVSYSQGTIDNAQTLDLTISAQTGTLFMNGGTGSGSQQVSVVGAVSQINADLASLRYVPTPGANTDRLTLDASGVYRWLPVSISGTGTPTVESWTGAVSSDWNTAGNWSGGFVPTAGDTAVIPPNTPNDATLTNAVLTGETITLAVDANDQLPVVNFTNVTLGSGTLLQTTAPGDFGYPMIDLAGTLTIDSGATVATTSMTGLLVESGGGATVVNNGLILDAATPTGGFLANTDFVADMVNHGTILVDTTAQFGGISFQSLTNDGSIGIAHGEIAVGGSIAGGTIDFSGPGSLRFGANAFTDGATVAGFGRGDSMGSMLVPSVTGNSLSFNNGTLDISASGTLLDAVDMVGSLGLGNFELLSYISGMGPSAKPALQVLYAPDGEAPNPGSTLPGIVAPATASVSQDGTLALGDVSVVNADTLTLDITAGSGTLYMPGASGSGTNHLVIGTDTSGSQVNADLAGLRYVPAAGSSSDIVTIAADDPNTPLGPSESVRSIPVTIGSGSSGPVLTEPSQETVVAGGTVAVSGSYSDSYAASTPGSMFVEAIAQTGTMFATDASGQAAAGSGTHGIRVSTSSYADINAILHSLTYDAAGSAGSDSIHLEVWNQAGVMSADNIPVTVTAGGGGGGDSGPTLQEPGSETVSPDTVIAVAGSYSDSYAAGNPGMMFLHVSDSSGTLSATDAGGNAVAGSGSNDIAVTTSYADVNAILASLHYAAGASAGNDTIHFDLWNQAGTETTGATAITIDPPAGGSSPAALTMLSPDHTASLVTPLVAPH